MKRLIIGAVLLLLWMSLSTWYYTAKIFPVTHPMEEVQPTEAITEIVETPPEAPPLPAVPEDITLYFGFDKTVILNTADLQKYMPGSLDYLNADTLACMQIVGYTCNIGTESYNMNLGKRRAIALQSYLLEKGFAKTCMQISSKGEADPAVANTSEENRKLNRRVEVHIHH